MAKNEAIRMANTSGNEGREDLSDTAFIHRMRALGIGADSIDNYGTILKPVFLCLNLMTSGSRDKVKIIGVTSTFVDLQMQNGETRYLRVWIKYWGNAKITVISQKEFDEK